MDNQVLVLGCFIVLGLVIVIHDELQIRETYKQIIDTCKAYTGKEGE